jgi:NDP-sugar pyrophosphorylase family protein
MGEYRQLTADELAILENNNCWAEDWSRVEVAENFKPYSFHRVMFYGDIRLGEFNKQVEVSKGFFKHAGINDATLRNVTVGNDCLIEKVANYINNYTIGDDCYISNVYTMETTEDATYGEGSVISVLNEMGDGNVTIFRDLNSQLAKFMVKHSDDKQLRRLLMQLIEDELRVSRPERGLIGNNVKIINAKDITNTVIKGYCEISGASRLSECTVMSSMDAPVFIGTGVICENSIICDGCSINNSVKMQDCFVGEACQITNGFTAEASLFFANSFMANGEACAAFCGPFSASHHKSSLLIGGEFSFYNAGSNTNFSNHAYKMGPMHYGVLERGTKTASGSYVLMPATIGAFSVCFGKLMNHPDMRNLPFSYLMAYGDVMYIVPGRNITTVGLYRDIKKWPNRDRRSKQSKKSIINFDWLSPFTVGEILEGIKILKALREASGDNVTTYNFHEYVINASSLRKGLKYYDIALRIYMGAVLKRQMKAQNSFSADSLEAGAAHHEALLVPPSSTVGQGAWVDLSGLLMPQSEEQRLISDIKSGVIDSVSQILDRFDDINNHYRDYRWAWSYQLILDYYHLTELDQQACERIREDYVRARRAWIAEIRKDAEKEFQMGDVEQEVYDDFLSKLDHEIDYEN